MTRGAAARGVRRRLVALVIAFAALAGPAQAKDVPLVLSKVTYGSSRPQISWSLINERGKLVRKLDCNYNFGRRSHDGRRGVCVQDYLSRDELLIVDLSTGASSRIAKLPQQTAQPQRTSQFEGGADWAPDNRHFSIMVTEIHYAPFPPGGSSMFRTNVVMYDAVTGGAQPVTDYPFASSDSPAPQPISPVLTRDGSHVIYAETRGSREASLQSIDVASGARKTLVKSALPEFTLSPNSRRIAFCDKSGTKVKVADASGQVVQSFRARGATVGAWSPNNRRFVFEERGSSQGKTLLRIYDTKTRKITKLPEVYDGELPVWAPNSKRLATNSLARGAQIINLRGKVLRQLARPRKGFVFGWAL